MGSRAASKVTGKPRETRGRPPASTEQPLTRKQELFVKELVSKDGQITLREAAINAGYSATSAHSRAYELTNQHISPHVVAAINSYRRELDEKYGVTYEQITSGERKDIGSPFRNITEEEREKQRKAFDFVY